MSAPSNFFIHDACLRCCRPYRHGEACLLVYGNDNARYQDIGLVICAACHSEDFDSVVARPIYPHHGVVVTWPRYFGTQALSGFAKLAYLSNGVYRIGLHRGHVEVWRREELPSAEQRADLLLDAYTANYSLYGRAEMFSVCHRVQAVKFLDLCVPRSLLQAEGVRS